MIRLLNTIGLVVIFYLFSLSPVKAAFTVSNLPTTISEDQVFSAQINLIISGSAGNQYYLRAVFSHPNNPTSYFGYTKNNSDSWYNGKPSPLDYTQFYQITMDTNNSWIGAIEVKLDPQSPDYQGPGQYNFKVGRYTSSGSLSWSDNTELITVVAPSPSPSSSPTPTPTPSPSPSPTPSMPPSPSPSPDPSITPTPSPTPANPHHRLFSCAIVYKKLSFGLLHLRLPVVRCALKQK